MLNELENRKSILAKKFSAVKKQTVIKGTPVVPIKKNNAVKNMIKNYIQWNEGKLIPT